MSSLNAGPEYYAAEERYRSAKTNEDKRAALQDMLRLCPKHKASESVLLEIKGKLSKLRKEEANEKKKEASKKRGKGEFVKRQGAAQIVLLGFANSGKSALLNALTNAKVQSTDVPYETREATPAMMEFERIQIQIVDMPSAMQTNRNRIYAAARDCDLALILIDPLQNEKEQMDFFAGAEFERKFLLPKMGFAGKKKSGFFSYDVFEEKSVSELKRKIIGDLDLIRIYTKNPKTGEIDNEKPFVLKRDSNVKQLAKHIHADIHRELKFAKVWGSSKFAGQKVSHDYILKDGDIVELHRK